MRSIVMSILAGIMLLSVGVRIFRLKSGYWAQYGLLPCLCGLALIAGPFVS